MNWLCTLGPDGACAHFLHVVRWRWRVNWCGEGKALRFGQLKPTDRGFGVALAPVAGVISADDEPEVWMQRSRDVEEDLPKELLASVLCSTVRCEVTYSLFDPPHGAAIAWVRDGRTGGLFPYAIEGAQADELEKWLQRRRCGMPPPPPLQLAAGGRLGIVAAEARHEYAHHGVVRLPGVLPPPLVDALRRYFARDGFSASPGRRGAIDGVSYQWSEAMARHLNHQLLPLVERLVGRRLRDSSPLVLFYPPDSSLAIHRDDDVFDVSLSVSLGRVLDDGSLHGAVDDETLPLPALHFVGWGPGNEDDTGVTRVAMRAGDGVLFAGSTMPHYRNAIQPAPRPASTASSSEQQQPPSRVRYVASVSLGYHFAERCISYAPTQFR